MLRSEINELEKSVGELLENSGITKLSSYQNYIAEQAAHVQNVCSALKKKWTQELLSNAKEQVIKRYVLFHQAGIIELSDKVSKHEAALNIADEISTLINERYQQVNAALENLLEFLRGQFYQYFDVDRQASYYHCELLALKVATFGPELRAFKNAAIDDSLISCVFTSVNEIVAEGLVSGISYRQANQCLSLVRMIRQLLYFGTNTTTEVLIKALYQQNLNSLYFQNWYRNYFFQQIAKMSDKKEKRDFVNMQIVSLAGIFVSPEKALQPELPAIDLYILSWLQEQIGESEDIIKAKPPVQLPLNLSVPQFALFIRIFYKTGCFPAENVAMIIRFFTEHFTTKKQPHISHKSFGRAFYSLDQSAAAIVRDFLQKMLNYLNKTYFP